MSQIQDVKQASDIIQVIGERITLQRSGTNWRGLCPFHSEKSPSFFVSEQFQRYKCFGCSEAGDVFTFLEKYDGLSFAEALQVLADRAGIILEKQQLDPQDELRKRVLEALDLAKEYYHYVLKTHAQGEIGRQYIQERGVQSQTLELFQLGYSINSWDGLYNYLHGKKNFTDLELESAGLILKGRTGRYYDRFRGRLMFPLTDHRGRVVGFSGRTLIQDAKEAKYINSPETMVYHKSQMLFGFSQLYQDIRKANEVVVVEGEFDVLSSLQAHVPFVVGVKGSVLTEDHCRLLSRTVPKLILSFDMDKAGLAATRRAIQTAKPFGLELRVIQLPDEFAAKDPDDLARSHPDIWRQATKTSISIYEFALRAASRGVDISSAEGKRQVIDQFGPVLQEIPHAVERDFYITKVAEMLNVNASVIQSDLQRIGQAKRLKLTGTSTQISTIKRPKKRSQKEKLVEYVLFLLVNGPSTELKHKAEKLKHLTVPDPQLQSLLKSLADAPVLTDIPSFAQTLPEDLNALLFSLAAQAEYLPLLETIDLPKEWEKAVQKLIELDIGDSIKLLTHQLDEFDAKHQLTAEEEKQQAELLQKIVKLRNRQQQR